MRARQIPSARLAHIPEDREKDGLVGKYSMADNMMLTGHLREPFARRGIRR